MWKLQSWVQDRVDPKLRALANYPKPTIGIHVRGGDKAEEDVFKASTYQFASFACSICNTLNIVM